jgi:hypothetical protein
MGLYTTLMINKEMWIRYLMLGYFIVNNLKEHLYWIYKRDHSYTFDKSLLIGTNCLTDNL